LPLQPQGSLQPVIAGRQLPAGERILVHRRILAQALRTPDAPALSDAEQRLNYRQLAAAVAAVAAGLRARGLGAGARIGLCLERSVAVVIAALGVLEAGAAYIPLDPEYPTHLLLDLLSQTEAAALLSEPGWAERFAETGIPLLTLADLRGSASARQPVPADAAALAYICFTSGSTGRPKGVAIGHDALANYVAGMLDELEIEPGSRFGLVSTFAADLGNTAIFLSLASGGSLCIFPEQATTQPASFAALMRAESIDYLKIVPSHLNALIDPLAPVLPRKGLILGGEATPRALAERLIRPGGCRLYNHYGPTEATIGCLCYRVPDACAGAEVAASDAGAWSATLPLDRAVPDSAVLLLDGRARPVPAGVPGELYIAGRCLSHGYVGREDSDVFSAFVEVSGFGRCYRSGDLAREIAPGLIEVLGRVDRQINLHGHRVEPAQVEQVLLEQPLVAQAVVLPDPPKGAARLLAWVVPSGERATPAGFAPSLHEALAARLPRHLRPALIQVIERIPLTANGKLDAPRLRQLTDPQCHPHGPAPTADVLVARDLLELRLAALWAEALGLEQVARDADFFALGGHSLLAVTLASRILEEFGVDLPLATFFTQRTLQAQAQLLRAQTGADAAATTKGHLVPIRATGSGPAVLLLPGAGGSPVYFESLAQRLGSGRPIWAVHWRPDEPAQPGAEPIAGFAERCLVELGQRLDPAAGLHLVGHSFGGLLGYALAVRLNQAGRAPLGLYIIDNPAPGVGWTPDYAAFGHADWLLHIGRRIARLYGIELHLTPETLAGLDEEAADSRFLDALLAGGALPPDSRRDYVQRFVAHYRTQAMAAVAYRPPHGPGARATVLFRAQDDDPALGRAPNPADPALGWGDQVGAPVAVVMVPGTHIDMLLPPHVAALARALSTAFAANEVTQAVHP
jgi:amino acid adenylation domain-containing protein